MDKRQGFTLIELLVVITIIVVLLALLTPALDKAIYRAELAVCAAQQRSVGTSVVQYAHDFHRKYPWREAVHHFEGADASDWRPNQLYKPNVPYDDRTVLKPYVPLKMLNDPLAGSVDLEIGRTDPDSLVFTSYSLWFGFKYKNHAGLLKVGDRLNWQDDRFRVLLSDADHISQKGPFAQVSHPDHEGKLVNYVLQDYAVIGANFGGASAGVKFTWAVWGNNIPLWKRGPIERTFAYDDLSVETWNDVVVYDPRLIPVPTQIKGTDPEDPAEFLPTK